MNALLASWSRAAVVWLLSTGGVLALSWVWAPELVAALPVRSFEEVLVRGCSVVVLSCLVWAWLVTTVVVLEVLRRSTTQTPGVPGWARAVVLLACGAAAVGLAAPAGATVGSGELDLDGLPMPDRATGGFLAQTVAAELADAPVTPGTTAHEVHVVTPGESLWSIAGSELGDPHRWPEIHRLNRALVGPDPDLITPDQHLDLPHPT